MCSSHPAIAFAMNVIHCRVSFLCGERDGESLFMPFCATNIPPTCQQSDRSATSCFLPALHWPTAISDIWPHQHTHEILLFQPSAAINHHSKGPVTVDLSFLQCSLLDSTRKTLVRAHTAYLTLETMRNAAKIGCIWAIISRDKSRFRPLEYHQAISFT